MPPKANVQQLRELRKGIYLITLSDLAKTRGIAQLNFLFWFSVQDPGTNKFHRLRCDSATSAVPSERNFFLSWYPVMKGENAEKIITSLKVATSGSFANEADRKLMDQVRSEN